MTTHRFLDGMGYVMAEDTFADHASAFAWATEEDEAQRVEYRGPEGDWRWAGPLLG